ncbi:hypothetical protein BDZ91DRAFT_54162 [Kalaharituber pfeilii]|nr:hypothetical protein BDZ91DRAFT_54162 [Kalaharituber pfeilii]
MMSVITFPSPPMPSSPISESALHRHLISPPPFASYRASASPRGNPSSVHILPRHRVLSSLLPTHAKPRVVPDLQTPIQLKTRQYVSRHQLGRKMFVFQAKWKAVCNCGA